MCRVHSTMVIYPGLRGKDDTFSAQDKYHPFILCLFSSFPFMHFILHTHEALKIQIAQIRTRTH